MVREFMTHWDEKVPIWFEREEDDLIGTQRSGGRPMPRIRLMDLFRGPTNREGNKPIPVWAGEDGVIEAAWTVGAESHFRRPADYDVLVLQFCGRAAVESEMGEFALAPGYCLHLPAGVAYRVVGNPECRQLVVDRGRLTLCDDPEIREIAVRSGDPDDLLEHMTHAQ